MGFDFRQLLTAVAIMKMRNPTPESLIDVADHIFQWRPSQLSAGHVCKAAFDRFQGFPEGLQPIRVHFRCGLPVCQLGTYDP
jgi:hypothetical protein